MSDDAKEWANIRIEEPVRDAARDDPRTYTEIMRAGLGAEPAVDGDVVLGDGYEEMAGKIADGVSANLKRPDTVSLDAAERHKIAQEVAEVLQG